MVRDLDSGNGVHESPFYAPQVRSRLLHAHLSDPLVRRVSLGDERADVDVHVDSRGPSYGQEEIHQALLLGLDIHERQSDHEIELGQLPAACLGFLYDAYDRIQRDFLVVGPLVLGKRSLYGEREAALPDLRKLLQDVQAERADTQRRKRERYVAAAVGPVKGLYELVQVRIIA